MTDLKERILRSIEEAPNGCWEWTGAKTRGYGTFTIQRGGVQKGHRAHRAAYEAWVGPIPEGLVIDHLCRNTACVNPEHLEPVTQHENLLRSPGLTNVSKTHCKNGHEFTPENTKIQRHHQADVNVRVCVTCRRATNAAYRARRAARKAEAA